MTIRGEARKLGKIYPPNGFFGPWTGTVIVLPAGSGTLKALYSQARDSSGRRRGQFADGTIRTNLRESLEARTRKWKSGDDGNFMLRPRRIDRRS
jgi:hypothetical protein